MHILAANGIDPGGIPLQELISIMHPATNASRNEDDPSFRFSDPSQTVGRLTYVYHFAIRRLQLKDDGTAFESPKDVTDYSKEGALRMADCLFLLKLPYVSNLGLKLFLDFSML